MSWNSVEQRLVAEYLAMDVRPTHSQVNDKPLVDRMVRICALATRRSNFTVRGKACVDGTVYEVDLHTARDLVARKLAEIID